MLGVAVRQFPRSSGGGLVVNSAITDELRKLPELSLSTFVSAQEISAESNILLCMGTLAIRAAGKKTILWPLNVSGLDSEAIRISSTTPANWLRYRLLRYKVGRALRKADALIFDSHFARDVHQQAYPWIKRLPTLAMRPGLQPPLEMQNGPIEPVVPGRIAMVSHLYPYKMIIESIRAFRSANAKLKNLELIIAGRSTDKKYHDLVQTEIGNATDVKLLGCLDASGLSKLYSSAQAILFSSLTENAGSFTLFDAAYFGKAIICSDRSSMPEAMGDSVLYVDPKSSEQIANAIIQVVSNADTRQHFEAKAQQRAAALETWSQRARQVADFLIEVDR